MLHGRFRCGDLVSHGPINSTAWKNNFGNFSLQVQLRRLCNWQDYGNYQDKQNQHCMMAGVDLEKDASGHDMSNQHNTNLEMTCQWRRRKTKARVLKGEKLGILSEIGDNLGSFSTMVLCSIPKL